MSSLSIRAHSLVETEAVWDFLCSFKFKSLKIYLSYVQKFITYTDDRLFID